MTGTTSKATSPAGTDTRPLTATAMHRAALGAIPSYIALTDALSALAERLEALRAPTPPGPDVGQLTGRLVCGEALPEIGELGEAVAAAASRIAAATYERQLIEGVRDELARTRQLALRSGHDAAFTWLDSHLHTLLDRAREILRRLGDVRTAEMALDSKNPTTARDQLRELRGLAREYATLREAQVLLVGHADDHARTPRSLTWAEQVALVRDHGTVGNPSAAGTPPVDMVEQLVWLIEGEPAPRAFVPGYRELLRRADAAQPAKPPSPTTDEDEPEPYLDAAGAGAQRLHRLQARAVLAPPTS